jgi:hypothetical protein
MKAMKRLVGAMKTGVVFVFAALFVNAGCGGSITLDNGTGGSLASGGSSASGGGSASGGSRADGGTCDPLMPHADASASGCCSGYVMACLNQAGAPLPDGTPCEGGQCIGGRCCQ